MTSLPHTRAVPARDRDLLDADNYLTDPLLDTLWGWFNKALEEKVDPQMVFVKLVNVVSTSLPYHQHGPLFTYLDMMGFDVNTCLLFTIRRGDLIEISFLVIRWIFWGGQRPATLPRGILRYFPRVPGSSRTSQMNMHLGLPVLSCHQA